MADQQVGAVMKKNISIGIAAASIAFPATAWACQDGYYEACAIVCVCLPNSGEVIDVVTKPTKEAYVQTHAPILEQWIINSRNSAIGAASPIPANIRYQLEPYVGADVLNMVRYKVGDEGFFNAGRNVLFNPDVGAITLVDLVVFRSNEDALTNHILWAHELKHVMQYRAWGTRDFSLRYIRDFDGVEREAYDFDNYVRNQPPRNQPIPGPGPGWPAPPGYGPPISIPVRFCQTPVVTCQIAPAYVPVGTPCQCTLQNGQMIPGSAF